MTAHRLLAAILLALAAPGWAGQRATYLQADGKRLVIDVADNGDARIGEAGKDEYGLLLKDGFYMVSREDGAWQAAKLADVAAAIDQVMPPTSRGSVIFRGIFEDLAASKPSPAFRIEPAGTKRVGGRAGKVYRVYGMNDAKPGMAETFVMSDDPALAPVGRAMEQFMNGAMVPAAVFIGPAAADIVAATHAIFVLGTPLDTGGRFKLERFEEAVIPAAATTLPVRPATREELVGAMKASMQVTE